MPANLKLAIHGWNTMTRITDVRGDLQAESAGWPFYTVSTKKVTP